MPSPLRGLVPLVGRLVSLVGRLVSLVGRLVPLVGRLVPLVGRLVPLVGRLVPLVERLVPLATCLVALLAGLTALVSIQVPQVQRILSLISAQRLHNRSPSITAEADRLELVGRYGLRDTSPLLTLGTHFIRASNRQ